jgi:hypothetical protein
MPRCASRDWIDSDTVEASATNDAVGMGYRLRWFIAEDDGTVTRVPAATCARWFDGEDLLAARAGRDLKLLGADANHFWWPTDGQLRALGTALLKHPPMSLQLVDLRTAVVTPGQALPDR